MQKKFEFDAPTMVANKKTHDVLQLSAGTHYLSTDWEVLSSWFMIPADMSKDMTEEEAKEYWRKKLSEKS